MNNKDRIVYLLAAIFLCIIIITLRLPHLKFRGFLSDEATYLSIAQSIVYDKDIYYEPKDLIRVYENYPSGPQGIFLRKTSNNNLIYAKSIIYPLFASIFYKAFQERGFLIFNALIAVAALYLAYLWLRRLLGDIKLLHAIVISFFFCSTGFLYIFWMTPEVFNFSTVLIGMVLFSYKFINKDKNDKNLKSQSLIYRFLLSKYSSILGTVFIALATCSKPPNIILTMPIGLLLIKEKNWRELLLSIVAFGFIIAVFFGSYYMLTGDWNFMGGERKTFYQRLPFDSPSSSFDNLGVSHTAENYWNEYYINFSIIFHNIFYYFLGRFSGIFLYFPMTLIILISFTTGKKSGFSILIFILIIAQIIGYTILIPHNYFGGGGTLGNRYFMNIYPLFFFLLNDCFTYRRLILSWMLTALFVGQMLLNVLYFSFYPFSHAKYFPFTLFPPEMTMVENLPTNVNPHAFRIPLEENPKFYLYFLNDNFYIPERGGFWIPGEKEVEFIIETSFKPKTIKFLLENGLANNNKITIKLGNQKAKVFLVSGERREVELSLQKDYFYTRNKWFYRVKVKSRKGYIPAFWNADYRDRRFLGCFVKIKIQ